MSKRTPFTFTILRYRHDAFAGEQVNVGVVLHAAEAGFLDCKMSLKYGRLKNVFPDMDGEAFRSSLRAIRRGLAEAKKRERGDMLSSLANSESFAVSVLRHDDSSFSWGKVGSGITNDPKEELDHLFKRFVTWYEISKPSKRSDDEVWKPVREKLAERHLADRLKKREIKSDRTSVEFDYTWRNGALHCYQPLSFDLASKDSIQDKVARWSGHLFHLENPDEDFVPHFLVGRPADKSLQRAYKDAVTALKASPRSPVVYEESELETLVDTLEDEMRAHDQQVGRNN